MSYSYDALSRRADRTVGSTTETAHYGDLSDIATLDTSGSSVIRSFVSGPVGLVEQENGPTTSFPLPDAHGDVTTLLDDAGTVASRQEFDPWGGQLAGPALEMGWLGAQERRFESTPGTAQTGVRAYDPSAARFMSEDLLDGPVELPQSHNRYQYALSNPLTTYDLTGLFPVIGDTCVLGVIDCGEMDPCDAPLAGPMLGFCLLTDEQEETLQTGTSAIRSSLEQFFSKGLPSCTRRAEQRSVQGSGVGAVAGGLVGAASGAPGGPATAVGVGLVSGTAGAEARRRGRARFRLR